VTPQSGNLVSTSLGNSGLCWTVFAWNRDTAVPAEGNGDLQTLIYVLVARSRRCPHCQILNPDKTEWRLILATLCGWRWCFVADQLWLMTRIREEEEVTRCVFQVLSDDHKQHTMDHRTQTTLPAIYTCQMQIHTSVVCVCSWRVYVAGNVWCFNSCCMSSFDMCNYICSWRTYLQLTCVYIAGHVVWGLWSMDVVYVCS